MFYPLDSLKKGGPFYLCWIADSWPLQFEKITNRNQRLRSQDIPEICEHLRELMTSESGRPTNRFSLRLSSQLLRGLTRVYQKKVDLFVRDVWKINKNVITYKTQVARARTVVHRRRTAVEATTAILQEIPEEVDVEKLLENATNTVARIEDITLRDPVLPASQLIDDGFGELIQDPVEMMLAHDASVMQQSALELPPLDISTEKSHEKSRLAPHEHAHMERISEHDISVFRKSVGDATTLVDFEKELPDISEIPQPELPVPEPQKQVIEQPLEEAQVEGPTEPPTTKQAKENESQVMVLKDLEEEEEPQRKKRKRNQLKIDKNIKLSCKFLRERVGKNDLEQRCTNAVDDIMDIRRPANVLLSTPAHSGVGPISRFGQTLGAMFTSRLANAGRTPTAERYVEEVLAQRETHIEPVESEVQAETTASKTIQEPELQGQSVIQDMTNLDISARNIPEVSMAAPAQCAMDISDMLTQKVLTVSQEKRASELESAQQKKRRHSERLRTSVDISAGEANKENIPGAINIPVLSVIEAEQQSNVETVTSVLQHAGLAEGQTEPAESQAAAVSLRVRSEDSEQLGSLDRTSVSLGESERSTDSKKFLNEQWGTMGTMNKIVRCLKKGISNITVDVLLSEGPVLQNRSRITAARCFTSILKLKSHGVIEIVKKENTNEIQHIKLGPKLHRLYVK